MQYLGGGGSVGAPSGTQCTQDCSRVAGGGGEEARVGHEAGNLSHLRSLTQGRSDSSAHSLHSGTTDAFDQNTLFSLIV